MSPITCQKTVLKPKWHLQVAFQKSQNFWVQNPKALHDREATIPHISEAGNETINRSVKWAGNRAGKKVKLLCMCPGNLRPTWRTLAFQSFVKLPSDGPPAAAWCQVYFGCWKEFCLLVWLVSALTWFLLFCCNEGLMNQQGMTVFLCWFSHRVGRIRFWMWFCHPDVLVSSLPDLFRLLIYDFSQFSPIYPKRSKGVFAVTPAKTRS